MNQCNGCDMLTGGTACAWCAANNSTLPRPGFATPRTWGALPEPEPAHRIQWTANEPGHVLQIGHAEKYTHIAVVAEDLDKWEAYVLECARGAKTMKEFSFRVGDQEWSGSLRELMAKLINQEE